MYRSQTNCLSAARRELYVIFATVLLSTASFAEDQVSPQKANNQRGSDPVNALPVQSPSVRAAIPATNPQRTPNPKANQSIPGAKANPQPTNTNGFIDQVGELQPVLHARQAALTSCMDNIIRQSGKVINQKHSAISTWSKNAPNENAFESIIGLSDPNNSSAPNGLAVIFAAPINLNKCEGQSIQIHPIAVGCTKAHANLLQIGQTIGSVGDLPVIITKDGARNILIPTPGSGCVIVSVNIH